jgi:hypothetical protein
VLFPAKFSRCTSGRGAAGEIVEQIPPGGPYPDGTVAVVTAVDRTLNAPVVSCDGQLTYSETNTLFDVEEY